MSHFETPKLKSNSESSDLLGMKVDSFELDKLEELIRSGRSSEARTRLLNIAASHVPRRLVAQMAFVSIRVGAPKFGISILQPIVQPRDGRISDATAREKVEYGGLLQVMGAYNEGLQLLKSVSPDDHHKTLLYQSFIHFARWDYDKAIPVLEEFLSRTDPKHYDALIGRVNLVSALANEYHEKQALEEFGKLKQHPQIKDSKLIYGNAHVLLANYFALVGQTDKALEFLTEAESLLVGSHLMYKLYVERWLAFVAAMQGQKEEGLTELLRIKAKAESLHRWETIRDTDLLIHLVTKDPKPLARAYFGTPHEGYRRRIRRAVDHSLLTESHWDFGNNEGPTIDLSSNSFGGQKPKPAKVEKFLWEMSRDLYRWQTMVSIFDNVFEGQSFNITSSGNSVYNLISKCRKWLKKSGLPLDIENSSGQFYFLDGLKDVCLRLPQSLAFAPDKNSAVVLRGLFGQSEFSTKEAAEALGEGSRSASRKLRELVELGQVESLGPQNMRRYKFLNAA